MLWPALTSVCQPKHELGATAAELLLEQLRNPENQHRSLRFEPELVVRASDRPDVERRGIRQPIAWHRAALQHARSASHAVHRGRRDKRGRTLALTTLHSQGTSQRTLRLLAEALDLLPRARDLPAAPDLDPTTAEPSEASEVGIRCSSLFGTQSRTGQASLSAVSLAAKFAAKRLDTSRRPANSVPGHGLSSTTPIDAPRVSTD